MHEHDEHDQYQPMRIARAMMTAEVRIKQNASVARWDGSCDAGESRSFRASRPHILAVHVSVCEGHGHLGFLINDMSSLRTRQ